MDIIKKDEQPLRYSPATATLPDSVTGDASGKLKRRRRIICWSTVIGINLLIFLVVLILSLTVFRARKPEITINSIKLDDLDLSVNPIPLNISLNLTLSLEISIRNPNKVSAKYRNTSAALLYRGKDIGNVPVPAGRIGSDDTTRLNLTLTVFADRVATDGEIYRDILKGNLGVTAYTRIKAKVRVLFIHIHVKATSSCDVNIDIMSSSIKNQTCHAKVKI
ncbi:hypothetical protein SSX86_030748 [Deinandra increscens subsp. villosa]|uniref:Late embryogenesis abundant protein LEA-2 subgroup domain-containing protein n=1 Tax=Deinandra increscens subsp. villosa TaxID=3103831 RepID=A0AAP0CA90_9ASTR